MYVDVKSKADSIIDSVSRIPNKNRALLILHAGADPASAVYMRGKRKDCERCGIPCMDLPAVNYKHLRMLIDTANNDPDIGGIIVQLPLPEGWDEQAAVQSIAPEKDVDGFISGSGFCPCTPEGIMSILQDEMDRPLAGAKVLLVGKGRLIGLPLIPLLLNAGCTLTIAHSRSDLPAELAIYHDAVITGVGSRVIDLSTVNAPLIVDAGISRIDGKVYGDCYGTTAAKVTPVPGGVGLMTRAILMRHMGQVQ